MTKAIFKATRPRQDIMTNERQGESADIAKIMAEMMVLTRHFTPIHIRLPFRIPWLISEGAVAIINPH
jgi:K+/H+ antiporter YhaU regulatory subunit KhtT